MKRITDKQRLRDVKFAYQQRTKSSRQINIPWIGITPIDYRPVNQYVNKAIDAGLNHEVLKRRKTGITVTLPPVMDFDENYETTVLHLNVISKLVWLIHKNRGRSLPKKAYNLVTVNFDNLTSISTPAALVLTAEISNWEDAIRNKLKPQITNWSQEIYSQFEDLGFFDLFENKPETPKACIDNPCSDKKLVRYIKGFCGDEGKTKELKESIARIVGDKVNKWTFLHGGLDEAITNVFHHAYPSYELRRSVKESWYLTGSYNESTRELKVVFYDQGVGIPSTLPSSKWNEKFLAWASKIPTAERKKDEVLLKGAMEIGRTRTFDADRGKGLQDMLTFIKKRESGRLSVLSARGHYKFSMHNSFQETKSLRSKLPILGTLIIWSVIL